MRYKPLPIDTSRVALPRELQDLLERLAKNTHDVWAQRRLAEGWTYGRQRDDARRKHPDLVPYDRLTETEKEYDRETALQALKAIAALGYRIERPSPKPDPASGPWNDVLARVRARLSSPDRLALGQLLAIRSSLSAIPGAASPDLHAQLAHRILKVGEPLLAYDVLVQGLSRFQTHVRLRQLLGLALARSGATERAADVLQQLVHEGHDDGETTGLLARTFKDRWALATDPAQRRHYLRQAHQLYRKGYDLAIRRGSLDEAIYTGINASSTALLLGQPRKARDLAARVRALCLRRLASGADYWAEASLAEAALILGDRAEAERRYRRASGIARGQYPDLSSTRRQCRLLLKHLGEDPRRFDPCFAIPPVIVFAGHMIDRAKRPQPRFPPALAHRVRREIAARLAGCQGGIGYSGAACGADILFIEEMLRRKGEVQLVLPFPPQEFEKASVNLLPGTDWSRRFRRVLKRAARVVVASEQRADDPVGYEYCNAMLAGLARLRAQILDTPLIPLVVWDGRPGDGPGGAASFVNYWRSQGFQPDVVNTQALLGRAALARPLPRTPARPQPPVRGPGFRQRLLAILFADVVGYSRLREDQIPPFVTRFMGAIAALIDTSSRAPLVRYTWGDALHLVFDSVRDAGLCALALRDTLLRTRWDRVGLPPDLTLRIALHAGPVYSCADPVMKTRVYTGSHVSRAARIEPITPPGRVYASEPFAALAAARGVREFTCDYVGQIPLAKGYGIYPTYHVRRV